MPFQVLRAQHEGMCLCGCLCVIAMLKYSSSHIINPQLLRQPNSHRPRAPGRLALPCDRLADWPFPATCSNLLKVLATPPLCETYTCPTSKALIAPIYRAVWTSAFQVYTSSCQGNEGF